MANGVIDLDEIAVTPPPPSRSRYFDHNPPRTFRLMVSEQEPWPEGPGRQPNPLTTFLSAIVVVEQRFQSCLRCWPPFRCSRQGREAHVPSVPNR
jgi:hypothetical protein